MKKGYAGWILRVNLSVHKCTREPIDPNTARKFIGGVGYGAHLIFNELSFGIDPLGPENKIIFATSPLTGNSIPGGGSIMICFKSLAGTWGESRCGGDFGPDLRRAGFDILIIEGRSETPVYLEICDGRALLKDALGLLGKNVYEKTELITSAMPGDKKNTSVMCIGQAGENLVSFASLMCGDRAAGRNGGGAVMGSKNILAVAVSGSTRIESADSKNFLGVVKDAVKTIKNHEVCNGLHEFGTVGDMPANDEDGDWPTKNWQSNSWGHGAELFDQFQEKNLVQPKQCYRGCPIGCGRVCQVKDGPYKTPAHEGGEYETISSFTSFVLNKDIDVAVHCGYLCNKWGLDTISAGAMISFAMECFEKKILSQSDLDGIDLTWGNSAALPILIEKIVFRQGIGDLLAKGVQKAAHDLGNNAREYAIEIKGLEGPAHDPRSGKMLGIAYGTASRGMCHIHSLEGMAYDRGKMDWGMLVHGVRNPNQIDRWDEKGKGRDCALLQRGLILPDILCTCKFMSYAGLTPEHWARMISAVTGWNMDAGELVKVGERVLNLQRLFNVREGFSRKDDLLPKRVLSMPAFGTYMDNPDCVIKNYNLLLDEYYRACGWEIETGIPGRKKIEELELDGYQF